MSESSECQGQIGINVGKNTKPENPRMTRRRFLKTLPGLLSGFAFPERDKRKTEQLSGPYISQKELRLSADVLRVLSESLPEGISVDAEGNVSGLLDFEDNLTEKSFLATSASASSFEFLPTQSVEVLVRNSWYPAEVEAFRYYGTEYNSFAGDNVVIAVLDTGLFTNNYEIQKWFPGVSVNFLGDFSPGASSGSRDIYDNDTTRSPGGHGTRATTLMAAKEVGLVRPQELMVAKIYDSDGLSNIFGVAEALKTAVNAGADVVMLNWGFQSDIISVYFDTPLKIAAEKGVVIMSAAHNYGQRSPYFPAGFADQYDGLYSVSAIGKNGQPTSWTNRPGNIRNAFYLPGESVFSIKHTNQLYLMSGTSASTPMAAAFAAIAVSEFRKNNPHATRFQARREAMKALVNSGKNLNPIDPLGPNAKVPQLQSLYRLLGSKMPTWVKGEVHVPIVTR